MQIGHMKFDGNPRIVVSITDEETNEALRSRDIDALEIRVDQFRNLDMTYIEKIIGARAQIGIPIILTVRNDPAEGASPCACISDEQKLAIFESVAEWVDAFDIELRSPIFSALMDLAKSRETMSIVSWHDFNTTPPTGELERILSLAGKKRADIVKIATHARSMEDVRRLLAFTLQNADQNLITIAMGREGMISRLVFPMAGSLLTFSYVSHPTAPGQIPFDELKKDLNRYYFGI